MIRSAYVPGSLALVFLALALAGCAGKVAAPDPVSVPGAIEIPNPPGPEAPTEVVVRAIAAWNHLDRARYAQTLTADFQFAFAATDSAGNTYASRVLNRADELLSVRHMFETGTLTEPRLTSVAWSFGLPDPWANDPRPGKDPLVHQVVRATTTFLADNGEQQFRVTGESYFFVVRGDSAQLPPELVLRGMTPNPHFWYIELWQDDTGGDGSKALPTVLPSRGTTIGALKALYR